MTLNKKNQYASNEHSLISGYLDAVVDINCKMNVISDYDFYKIDPMLFSPARIVLHNLKTGRSFSAGQVREDVLKSSFAS